MSIYIFNNPIIRFEKYRKYWIIMVMYYTYFVCMYCKYLDIKYNYYVSYFC